MRIRFATTRGSRRAAARGARAREGEAMEMEPGMTRMMPMRV